MVGIKQRLSDGGNWGALMKEVYKLKGAVWKEFGGAYPGHNMKKISTT
jgi:hypothetical protein